MPKKNKAVALTFEDLYDRIVKVIDKFRYRWQLSSLAWMDFNDVRQILLKHINQKFNQYDQSLPIENWVATISRNQITNIGRNEYGSFANPCRGCIGSKHVAEGQCQIFGTQDSSKCGILAKWEKTKKQKCSIELPLALEYHSNEVSNKPFQEVDYDTAIGQLNEKLKPVLTKYEYRVYVLLFIEHKDKNEVAKIMGYRSSEKNRQMGYRRILGIEKIIYEKAKKLVYSGEIDF